MNPPPHPDKPTGVKRVYKKIRKRNHKNLEEYLKTCKAPKQDSPRSTTSDVSEKTAVKDEDSQMVEETDKDQAKENGVPGVNENVESK